MALASGFFNSINHDRVYNAEDFSRFFDGVITNGVFENYGQKFLVTTTGQGMNVSVGTGRAWFNGVWAYNDSGFVITIEPSHATLKRIDCIAIEVNHTAAVRAARFVVVKGALASNPEPPTLIDSGDIHQHAIAYITIDNGVTTITASKIDCTCIGDETPFVTSILQQTNISDLYNFWGEEFHEWEEDQKEDFIAWLETIQGILSDDAQANLTQKYLDIQSAMASMNLEMSFTLTAAGWTGVSAPYSQTVTVAGLMADMKAIFGVREGATDAQFLAASDGVLIMSAHANGTVTVKALGIKPNVDIPCTLLVSKYAAFDGTNSYGICTTAVSTAAKTVSISGFNTLMTGAIVIVKFNNGNTAASPTLKVSNTDAKPIAGVTSIAAGTTLGFVYNGSQWESMGSTHDMLYDVIDGGTW